MQPFQLLEYSTENVLQVIIFQMCDSAERLTRFFFFCVWVITVGLHTPYPAMVNWQIHPFIYFALIIVII